MDVIVLFEARKIFKQMYPATYNFRDDDNGAFPADWIDYDGTDCSTTIIASLDGHKKVMQLLDGSIGSGAVVQLDTLDQGLDTTVEFWLTKSSVAGNTSGFMFLFEDATAIIQLRWEDNDLDENSGGWASIKDGFLVANKLSHFRLVLDDTANTYDCYIDGVLEGAAIPYQNNSTSGVNKIRFYTDNTDTGFNVYVDAIAWSTDTNYKIGDNIHWRYYKELDDSFEDENTGTQGTSITWVDAVDTAASVEIINEFNEHKKVIRQDYTSGAGGFDYSQHVIGTQTKTGTYEFFVKTSDIIIDTRILLREDANAIVLFTIRMSEFQYHNGTDYQTISGAIPINNTWYHIKIVMYDLANDTHDIWIDNVKLVSSLKCFANQINGINKVELQTFNAGTYVYLDAFGMNGDSNYETGDNRTFDYHSQSYNDITSNCIKCEVAESEYEPSSAIIHDDTLLSITDLHIIQLYDENSDLRFEGLLKDRQQPGVQNRYYLESLNKGELKEQIDYTASSAGDVNSHLLLIHTNVGQEDGRLIYYTEDDPAGDITPNYRNRPTKDADRWLAAHGSKVLIIKPNGVCFLDSDRNPSAGAATITEASTSLMGPPYNINTITNQINRVEVFGAIDPATGTPFSGISEDTTAQTDGTGILKYYKRFRELQSDIDCQNRAIAIRTGTGFDPQILTIQLKSIYVLPGEIINFAYANRSFSATDCFVESARYNLVAGLCVYNLNTGIFDGIGMAQPQFSYAAEGSDDVVETLRATDIITFAPELYPDGGSTKTDDGIVIDAASEEIACYFHLPTTLDVSRVITFHVEWKRVDANADTISFIFLGQDSPFDGSDAAYTTRYTSNDALDASAAGRLTSHTYIITAGVLHAGYGCKLWGEMLEARSIIVKTITIQYFINRQLS